MTGTTLDPKSANVLYHDAAAGSYDEKWSISFDERSIRYVSERADRMLPRQRYGRVLEVGTGTGFFLLNLWQAGYVDEAHATDVSTGMLQACLENARRIGCDLQARPGDAERLPYEDRTFDLVVGHAVLHHLPDPRGALEEIRRVLIPGGAVFIAGEPTRVGDRLAERARTAARTVFRTADRLAGGRFLHGPPSPATTDDERILRDLEGEVDLHTFDPEAVGRWAREVGFGNVRVETEELLSSIGGWALRAIEAEARPGLFGARWAGFAYRSYLRLYALDRLLYRVLPKRLFYNLLLFGEKPIGG